MSCERDWFNVYGERALNHFGRITEAKVLTTDNAWRVLRDYNWDNRSQDTFYVYNYLTEERRPITEQQYNNDNTITEDGRLAI